jgi:agmatinase
MERNNNISVFKVNEFELENKKILLGVGFDGGSRFPGARAGAGELLNWIWDHDIEQLKDSCSIFSVPVPNQGTEAALTMVEECCKKAIALNNQVIMLGGDHSITVPAVEAFCKVNASPNVIVFDAHDDLDSGIVIRNWTVTHNLSQMANEVLIIGNRQKRIEMPNNVTSYSVDDIDMKGIRAVGNVINKFLEDDVPLYLSIDVDVLDPSECPGVSYPKSGGLTFRELSFFINTIFQAKKPSFVDLVEFNPLVEKEKSALVVSSILGKLQELLEHD